MSLTFTDIFCGAGGSSIGLTAAGYELALAANHWQRAIETHSHNFTDAEHLCADVNNYDMRRLPSTDVLWASPICTEVSPAGGRRRRTRQVAGQASLLEEFGPISSAGFERTRATFWDVIRATEVHRYQAVLVENVPAAADWELFDHWVAGMVLLGYRVQFVSVSSAHVGGDGNPHAPQWRDRLYIVLTRKGIPLPDVQPRPLAWCHACGMDVAAVQAWKRAGARRIGKYRQQYVYVCPERGHRVEPYVLPAAAAIDWSDLGQRIGDRARPLAAKTLARIEAGLAMFSAGALVGVSHDGPVRAAPLGGAPLPTQTRRIGEGMAVPPMLVPAGGTWNDTAVPVGEPMRTRTAREAEALVCPPFVTVLRNHGDAHGVDEPLRAMAAGGGHHGLTVPPGAFYTKHYGGFADPQRMAKPVSEPLGTLTASNSHSLVIPYRRGNRPTTTAEPLHTMTTRDSGALVHAAVDVQDCSFRMLKPREQLRAQRFPDSYRVLGNVGEQTMQAGNAVSANVAQWLGEQVAAVLGGARWA